MKEQRKMGKFFKACGGRTMAFAFLILVLGTILVFLGKLTSEYVALIGALQTLITGRAIAQDWYVNGRAKRSDSFSSGQPPEGMGDTGEVR
jgi:hypothetical protein